MAGTWKTVRVFISSTFRDMHAERDHLVTVVFPELRERAEQLGLEFFDVDLRWGVPARDANGETANSWEYCRQWVDRVEPFFVCILGQRYGWVPEPEQLKARGDRERQQVEQRSITDMEVRHAVLTTKLKRRSYFYLRATDAPATAYEYVDPPPLLRKLEQLKNEVRSCGRPVRDYLCEWMGSGFVGMDEFGRRVLDDLWSGVLRDERYVNKEVWRQLLGTNPDADSRYTDESQPVPPELWEKIVALARPAPVSPLDAECQKMDAFVSSRVRWFQGRTRELRQLVDFLQTTPADAPRPAHIESISGQGKPTLFARLLTRISRRWFQGRAKELEQLADVIDFTDEETPRLAVVTAVPGQGKSALLAKLSTLIPQPASFLITHFVGATERSASAYELVERLLGELDRSGITWQTERQEKEQSTQPDFKNLCLLLAQRLRDYTGKRPIVILLDALNQLSDGHDLQWLPARLGPGVRVIVSCIEDTAAKSDGPEQLVLRSLAARQPSPLRVPLGPLTEDDVRTIAIAYLTEYCHELDNEHLDTLCAITQAHNPLYLLVMLNELRTLGGNDLNQIVPARIASMPQDHPDTVSLFRWVLQRLEVFGPGAVRWWCLYLAHGRVGMASHELADLLDRKLGADAVAAAMRIERGLRRYLQRRDRQLDFFHSQFRQAVFEEYGPQANTTDVHSDIANYFRDLADPEKNQSWKGKSRRPFLEMCFHLAGAQLLHELSQTLCDLHFVESRCRMSQVFELISDYRLPQSHSPDLVDTLADANLKYTTLKRLQDYSDFVQRRAHILRNHAHLTFQEAANQPDDTAPSSDAWNQQMSGAETRPWLHWINKPLAASRNVLTLAGHSKGVNACEFSPDGSTILSGSADGTLKLWNAHTGLETKTLLGHEGQVLACAFSPDGTRIVSGSGDASLIVWDSAAGCALLRLKGHNSAVTTCVYSPDGATIISGSHDNCLKLWDAVTGAELETIPTEALLQLAGFTPDGRWIVWLDWTKKSEGGKRAEVIVWDVEHKVVSRTISCEGLQGLADCNSCLMSPIGDLYLWRNDGPDSPVLEVWDVLTGVLKQRVADFYQPFVSAVSKNGVKCLAGSLWKEVRLLDARTGRALLNLGRHQGDIRSVAISPDGTRGVSASDDCTAKVWDLSVPLTSNTTIGYRSGINSCAYSRDGSRIVTGGYNQIKVWHGDNGKELRRLDEEGVSVRSCCFSPDGNIIVFAGNYSVYCRYWKNSRFGVDPVGCELWGHSDVVNGCAVSPDGSRILSASADGTLRIWDAATWKQLQVLRDDTGGDIAKFLPDGKSVVTNARYGWLQLLDADSGQELNVLFAHDEKGIQSCDIRSVCAISSDGRKIAMVGSQDGNDFVALLDGKTGEQLFSIGRRVEEVSTCEFSPDSNYLAFGTPQGQLFLWDTERQVELCEYAFDVPITALAWRPDGRALVVCDESGDIHLLDPQNICDRPPIISAWQDPDIGENAFSCPFCRAWSKLPPTIALTTLPCPSCGEIIILNPFTIKGDWKTIAEAW